MIDRRIDRNRTMAAFFKKTNKEQNQANKIKAI